MENNIQNLTNSIQMLSKQSENTYLTAEERKGLSSINREDKGLGGVRSPMKILELKQNIEHKLYKTRAPAHRSDETSVADV